MTTQIINNIETVKSHSKRLKKSLAKRNIDVKLTDVQEIFSESLGCKSWMDLNSKLSHQPIHASKNRFMIWAKQLQGLDKINLEYLDLFSNFKVNGSSEEDYKNISSLITFCEKNQKLINFNLLNMDGMNLLKFLIIEDIKIPFRLKLIQLLDCDNELFQYLIEYGCNTEELDCMLNKVKPLIRLRDDDFHSADAFCSALHRNYNIQNLKKIYSNVSDKLNSEYIAITLYRMIFNENPDNYKSVLNLLDKSNINSEFITKHIIKACFVYMDRSFIIYKFSKQMSRETNLAKKEKIQVEKIKYINMISECQKKFEQVVEDVKDMKLLNPSIVDQVNEYYDKMIKKFK